MALCTGMHSVGLATQSISTQRNTMISPDNGVCMKVFLKSVIRASWTAIDTYSTEPQFQEQ